MIRPVASILLALTLAVQANVVSCPMTGRHAGDDALGGYAHAEASGAPHHAGAPSEAPSSPTAPVGSPEGAGSEVPSPAPPATGGCGAMMGCGLAAVASGARANRGAAPLTALRASAPAAPVSPPPLSADPPPPRA